MHLNKSPGLKCQIIFYLGLCYKLDMLNKVPLKCVSNFGFVVVIRRIAIRIVVMRITVVVVIRINVVVVAG